MAAGRMARVLVVDDDPAIRSLLRIVVERRGHVVDSAVDGLDAIDRLGLHHYDLALIDLMMPRLNGYDLLREMESYRNPPTIVLVTAMHDRDVRDLDSRLVHSILRKPFDVEVVGTLIDDVLRALRAKDPAVPRGRCADAPADTFDRR